MRVPSHSSLLASVLLTALALCPLTAAAQPESVSSTLADLSGIVVADDGSPVEKAVVTAVGTRAVLTVTDAAGAFTIGDLPPGTYLLRVHRQGFHTGEGQWLTLVPDATATVRLMLTREGSATQPLTSLATASVISDSEAAGSTTGIAGVERSESWLAWHLRRLKRTILKDEGVGVVTRVVRDDGFSPADPFEYLGRVLGTSARAATAFLGDVSLDGQVDLLTTGAFDAPVDLAQSNQARGVAFFSVGADAGPGTWNVRAAVNQGELDSWTVAASYAGRLGDTHRYQSGMAYSLQRYQGATLAALAAIPENDRHVGSIFLQDEWSLSPAITLSYGGAVARYDYLDEQALLSGRVMASYAPADTWRAYASVSREAVAPGGQEFVAPARAQWLPPQRTFSSLTADRFTVGRVLQSSVGLERHVQGSRVGLRAFQQQVQNQFVTLFDGAGAPTPGGPGHYLVGTAGDVDLSGVTVSMSHLLWEGVRASVDYTVATSHWHRAVHAHSAATVGGASRAVPGATSVPERIHDVVSTVEAVVPVTTTRVFAVYRLNNAFVAANGHGPSRLSDGRFELQVNQSLPFMKFTRAQWEMLVAIRNMFYEQAATVSLLDEALVVGAPKRVVGGLTVRF
jgi:hypothetical protein